MDKFIYKGHSMTKNRILIIQTNSYKNEKDLNYRMGFINLDNMINHNSLNYFQNFSCKKQKKYNYYE